MDKELIQKITDKKEFSNLPKKDVKIAFEKFNKKDLADFQKIKLTRNLLRKIYSSFSSRKLLGEMKNKKDVEWVLKKHKSTKERFDFYDEIYSRIFNGIKGKASVIDLGAGVNGLSFVESKFQNKILSYVGVEAVGQLVDLMNFYFLENKLKNFKAEHLSLFNLEEIKKIIKNQEKPRIVLLFKVIDSLESLERDFSKKLIFEIFKALNKEDKIVLSFATKSLGKRQKFKAQRNWILKFIQENFNVLDDFEINGERYLIFGKSLR